MQPKKLAQEAKAGPPTTESRTASLQDSSRAQTAEREVTDPEAEGTDFQERMPFRGASARIVENMEASLSIPTATSYRSIPVKLLEENRRIINEHLASNGGAKVSFTHLIAWTLVQALKSFPSLNSSFETIDGAA